MHAARIQVQKEAERLVHHGHRHGLPRLDPEADASAIQLVGYWTTQEEIGDLFHQVYSLKRLPRPPPCGPKWKQEVMRDILASLKDQLRQRRGEQPGGSGEPEPTSIHPSCHQDRPSQQERQDTSGKQELTEAREAHWQALDGCCHIGGMNRKAQQVNNQNEARCPLPFPKLRPAKKEVLRVEPKAP